VAAAGCPGKIYKPGTGLYAKTPRIINIKDMRVEQAAPCMTYMAIPLALHPSLAPHTQHRLQLPRSFPASALWWCTGVWRARRGTPLPAARTAAARSKRMEGRVKGGNEASSVGSTRAGGVRT